MSNLTSKKRTGGGWNRNRAVGKKKAFNEAQVQLIRASIKAKGDKREIALFDVALESLLRSVDLLKLTVGDVTSQGRVLDEFEVRQQKTRRTVTVGLPEYARQSLQDWLDERRTDGDSLNPDSNVWLKNGRTLKRLRYAQIIKGWARLAYLDPKFYSTHSMRRTMASHVYRETANVEVVRQLLGHGNLVMTGEYLGIDKMHALDVKKKCRMGQP